MGVGGAANGQTLYDITCLLDEQVALDVAAAGQNTLHGTFAVGGYIEATSTTPTALGSYADPRFSVAFRAKLALTLAVQPNRDQTLRVSKALFTLGGATLDSHNFSGDVLKFVSDDLIPFFGGPNFKNLAEDAVNAVSVDFASRFDAALTPVNAQLKGPSDAVRVGVSGSAGYISVAFAPREIAPPANGSMSGLLRWDPTQFAPRNGCQSFDIRATVQTGPVPMFTANAEAPTRQVGVFQATPASANTCAFTMTGLAAGWPNFLTARVVDGSAVRSAGSSIYGVSYALSGDGWDGRKVIPQPVASERNYVVSRSIDATAIKAPDYNSVKKQVEYQTNPRINPADTRASDGSRKGDTVSLNPQPLPPGPDSVRTQNIAQNAGTQAGIIIVSGKKANPLAPKPSAVDQVFGSGVDPAVADRAAAVTTASSQESPKVIDVNALAARGEVLANEDPLALELRNQQPDDSARRGFDIGMAIAEGHTLPGPGKDRTCASLPAGEPGGCRIAVLFSVDRNKNAKLAARGEAIANQDPLAIELRNQQPDNSARQGFDIGMAAAEGHTAPGPGKDKTCASLHSPEEQGGCRIAVSFSVERNKNAKLAATGAAIAKADPVVAEARNMTTDVFYRLGFDIATGRFGNPWLGAQGNTAAWPGSNRLCILDGESFVCAVGNTATGPGSLGIRDSLSAAGQRGFNDSVKLHLSRKYKP
jgi:hypothetical protein